MGAQVRHARCGPRSPAAPGRRAGLRSRSGRRSGRRPSRRSRHPPPRGRREPSQCRETTTSAPTSLGAAPPGPRSLGPESGPRVRTGSHPGAAQPASGAARDVVGDVRLGRGRPRRRRGRCRRAPGRARRPCRPGSARPRRPPPAGARPTGRPRRRPGPGRPWRAGCPGRTRRPARSPRLRWSSRSGPVGELPEDPVDGPGVARRARRSRSWSAATSSPRIRWPGVNSSDPVAEPPARPVEQPGRSARRPRRPRCSPRRCWKARTACLRASAVERPAGHRRTRTRLGARPGRRRSTQGRPPCCPRSPSRRPGRVHARPVGNRHRARQPSQSANSREQDRLGLARRRRS